MNKNPQTLLNFSEKKLGGQAGISLYLSVIILAVILAIVLGLSAILFGQIKMVREMGYSVVAFYAADTGIERELFEGNSPPSSSFGYLDLNNNGIKDGDDASYDISVIATGSDCDAPVYCIRSKGTYKGTQRAIEVKK